MIVLEHLVDDVKIIDIDYLIKNNMELTRQEYLDFAYWYHNWLSNMERSENIEDDFNKWLELTYQK